MTDAELIIASRRDPRAFRALYDRWAERLLAYFYRRVLDPEVAADLLAETFAVAYQRRGRFKDRGEPGAAWLYGIAAKELSHWFRRQAVERRAIKRLGIQVPALDDESIARIEARPPAHRLARVSLRRRCFTAAALRSQARRRIGGNVTFRSTRPQAGVEYTDARQARLEQGCSIVADLQADSVGILVEIQSMARR